jgi:hypothetical protein
VLERFRLFLDRPLDPSAGRAILAFVAAILLGVALLFVLASSEPDRPSSQQPAAPFRPAPASPVEPVEDEAVEPRTSTRRHQDPQDVRGTATARHAARALRSHRALQHVPYRDGGVAVALVGARGGRAVLRVSGPSVAAARRGWHRFLRRYGDSGRAYAPNFRASGGRDG